MMKLINISANFSNASSRQEEETCDVLHNTPPAKIGKILALSLILLSSFIGNILIIITVYKRQELRKTINYFIVNMAVSDFVYPLTDIPVELTEIATSSRHWYIGGTAGSIFCKILSYLTHISVTVSIQSLVWIALDRFLAVLLPMKAHYVSSRFRTFAIASTWIVATAINSTDLYTNGLVNINKKTHCTVLKSKTFSFFNDKVHIYVIHIIPLTILAILYCAIAVTLRRQDKVLSSRAVHGQDQRKRQAMKMSLCVIGAFLICSLPMTIYNILTDYKIPVPCMFEKPFSFVSDLMFYLSSTINPIICFSFVGSYRRGLREMFNSSLEWCWNRRPTTQNAQETNGQDGIALRRIRESHGENLAFSDT